MTARYFNPAKAKHRVNVAAFERAIHGTGLSLYHPNPTAAPWHEQAKLECADGCPIFLNFWPCAGTACRDGEKAVHGEREIRKMIELAQHDAALSWSDYDRFQESQRFEVLE